MEINAVVSENARRLREEKRLTLDEAARLTGVSRSMLAQIEKGDVNPTISMVWCSASINAAIPPFFCASAIAWIAIVVLPEDSGP